MFKKISLIASMLFFLLGTNVFAHSHLESSTPKNGEILTQPLKDINLSYETNLEKTSTFALEDTNGKVIPISKITIEGNKLTGTMDNELPNGGYKIHWKIIGTDGHPLEGDIAFSVQLPESQTTAAKQATTENEKTADVVKTDDKNKATEAVVTKNTEKDALISTKANTVEPTFKDYVVPGSVGLLIIYGFGSYWLIYRRKHV
ncbi:copper resistance CopC family protein [Neobacillus pocheonensis]|uniref:copper resistance CopC family protein n=1 Tax=Neobacillus pocheonensis TaxID=363869 RepID=UPI003D27159C